MGKMLGEQADQTGALLGAEVAENLLGRRNAAVVEHLKQVPGVTAPTTGSDVVGNVAIFYGAAHLPDLERRITALGYHRAGDLHQLGGLLVDEVLHLVLVGLGQLLDLSFSVGRARPR